MPDPKKYYKIPPSPYARRQGEGEKEYYRRMRGVDGIRPTYPELMFVGGGGPARQTFNLAKKAPTLLQKVGSEAGKYIVPVLNYGPEAYSVLSDVLDFKKGGLMKDTDPKKYKKTVTNMPKTPVDSGPAQSIIRGGFNTLLPPNASQMLANTLTGDTRYGFEDMDPAMRFHVMRSVKNAIERTGENRGGTSYVDYSPEINKDIRDLSADVPSMIGGSYLSPEFQAATTMGRVSYDFDPETGTYTLYDSYDFSPIREDYDPGTVYGDVRKALGRNANQGSPQVIGRFSDKDYESMAPQYDKGYYREALDNPLVKGAQAIMGWGSDFLSRQGPSALPFDFKKGGVVKKEMIKRADGSYSQRGLWDNIRENAGSGRMPTKEMLKQERKIKKYFVGGALNAVGDKLISGDELDAKSIGRAALGGALKSMGSPMGMMGPMSAMMPKAKQGMKVSRFDELKGKIMKSGKNEDAAAAIAAAIGRKKYGKAKFQQMAAAGRRKSK